MRLATKKFLLHLPLIFACASASVLAFMHGFSFTGDGFGFIAGFWFTMAALNWFDHL